MTALIPLEYEGSVTADIIFKDDSALPGGSHYRTVFTLLVQQIRNGNISGGFGFMNLGKNRF